MNKKIDIAQIESTIDFESVSRRLEDLSKSGGLKHRKTVNDLLDRVKPSLLVARENHVSFAALAKFLQESGFPVSEPTLRQYLHAQNTVKKPRKRPVTKTPKEEAVEKPTPAEPSSQRTLPPRLARRIVS